MCSSPEGWIPEKTRGFSLETGLWDDGAPGSDRGPDEKEGLGLVGRGSGVGGVGRSELVIALFSYSRFARSVAAHSIRPRDAVSAASLGACRCDGPRGRDTWDSELQTRHVHPGDVDPLGVEHRIGDEDVQLVMR